MLLFLVRRLILVIPVIFGLLLLTFIMIRVVPTDPAAALAGENASAEQIAAIRAQFGFDQPVIVQFWTYLGQVVRGDFGISLYSNRPIGADILLRLPATLELTFVALLVAAFGGIAVGTLAAVWHNSWFDHLIRIFTVAGLALASFWLAIMLQLLFSMELGWLPLRGRLPSGMAPPAYITGLYLVDSLLTLDFRAFTTALGHLLLPALTLAFGGLATVARFTRSSLLETLQNDFVTYERAVGFPNHRIVLPYALRNSLVSPLNQIGLLFGGFISGAVVVEAIFDWPGLGSYLVGAILTADYKAILAVTLVVGLIYALVNIAVDLLQGIVDPRVGGDL
ncbi:ABC transporter permease [Aureimonas populi]|uniref:ABC transporter permease n=1 Tax=Aureimonas populi TaxID=1701758 RepID=A0ABW5CR69_9HYPH|nr:ABC transporter permease [Aureimonas populi]